LKIEKAVELYNQDWFILMESPVLGPYMLEDIFSIYISGHGLNTSMEGNVKRE
jgi:hypothetical protein